MPDDASAESTLHIAAAVMAVGSAGFLFYHASAKRREKEAYRREKFSMKQQKLDLKREQQELLKEVHKSVSAVIYDIKNGLAEALN